MLIAAMGCGKGSDNNNETTSDTTVANEKEETYPAEAGGEVTAAGKPEMVRVVVNGTIFTEENGRDEFEKELEEALGLDVVFEQQAHTGYADAVLDIFVSGEWPDVVLLSAEQYAKYVEMGVLWDMTEAYDNADFQSRLVSDINEDLKINGVLYGFSPNRGNGCVTYVKKAWMDAVGITSLPTTWGEYYDMLLKFTNEDPDGNGVNDTYGVSAARLIGEEAPYTNFLPEFYQDAYPDFLMDESGVWYDGFDTEAMTAALGRLQQGYQDGVIDPETLTQGTGDVRNKFYADTFGAFSYWAGTWNSNIINGLTARGLSGELEILAPLEETGYFLERQTYVWAITTACENPEGVFEYFLEPMLDGGEVQFLWTYGAKGTHWNDIAETVAAGNKEYTYEEGEFHMLPSPENSETLLSRNHLDPLLVIAHLSEEYTVETADEAMVSSSQYFMEHAVSAPLPAGSELVNKYSSELWSIKREVIQQVVVQNKDVEEWMQYYRDNTDAMTAEILAQLNE